MKRIQEKIKDLVDIRDYETVKNFASDPSSIIAAYRFTDVTADLMAKWLNEIIEISPRSSGAARALVGNRGVGKSHFLALLSALITQPELRTRITDQHVGLTAQRLPRGKHAVINVERGSGSTLIEELRLALDSAFGGGEANWGNSVGQMIATAAANTGEIPLVVIVDSAHELKSRIKRDDGPILAELAEAARQTRTFLAIALDDNIAGVDGVNAAIARTCLIDYLDQEHLSRIVDSFLYQKRAAARSVLPELYQGLREAAPGFNWSEPRFYSLYPIHPVVLDVTPAVRLYAPKFAFLTFAAEIAAKVMNHPAHSLVALDEVFDRVESDLRKAPELEETFQIYDELASNAISQIPIMQRLQAKLILKGLVLMSLDGRGVTARELSAAMLIYDENLPSTAIHKVEEIIALFASSVSAEKLRQAIEGNETRYSLGHSLAADFEERLAKAAQNVTSTAIERVLRRIGGQHFPDWIFGDFGFQNDERTGEFQIHWRGSTRFGRIVWDWGSDENADIPETGENLDWQIFIVPPSKTSFFDSSSNIDLPTIFWQIAPVRGDEEEAIRRFAALLTNTEITEEFKDVAIAAEQTATAIIERIWARIFLEDSKLFFNDSAQSFSSEGKAARILSESLENALAPVFDTRFPAHPLFAYPLTTNEISQIVSDLFGGANAAASSTQQLAVNFAAPLGLVTEQDSNFVLETDENLLKLPLIQTILEMTNAADGKSVSLREINDKLAASPFGLQREAQVLLLAALVARRRLEFVTASNDRITHRSLDLKIIWEDLAGVAQSSVQPRSSGELANWASLLTQIEDLISVNDNREQINTALQNWLDQWRKDRILERFDALPDEVLNVQAWRTAAQVGRTFGAAGQAIIDSIQHELSLEETLERVIDAFGDSPDVVTEARVYLSQLKCFIESVQTRQTAWQYLACAEATNDEQIEILRSRILEELALPENAFDLTSSKEFEALYQEFRNLFSEYYVRFHNTTMHSPSRLTLLEQVEKSLEYNEFIGLAALPISPQQFLETADNLRAGIRAAKCSFDVRQILQMQPFCSCGFRLIQAQILEQMPNELANTVQQGLATFRQNISFLAAPLVAAMNELANTEPNLDFANRARTFAELLERGEDLPTLSPLDVRLLAHVTKQIK